MPRVNFREARDRFNRESDNEFVSCDIRIPGPGGAYRIRSYPWWEHPLYIEAASRGETELWEVVFDKEQDDFIISIYPIGVRELRIGADVEIYGGWRFAEDEAIHLQFEDHGNIICNRSMDLEEWLPIARAINEKVKKRYGEGPEVPDFESLDSISEFGTSPSFHLGYFPYTIFQIVKATLFEFGVPIFISREPQPQPLPVFLMIGDENGTSTAYDYIVADDFEVEFPEIIHKPEWYVRKGG